MYLVFPFVFWLYKLWSGRKLRIKWAVPATMMCGVVECNIEFSSEQDRPRHFWLVWQAITGTVVKETDNWAGISPKASKSESWGCGDSPDLWTSVRAIKQVS